METTQEQGSLSSEAHGLLSDSKKILENIFKGTPL